MKKILLIVILFFSATTMLLAQAPQLINYQGVARSTTGTPLASQPIGLRFTIHDGTATGTTVYQETQTATTNSFGLYVLSIGNGTVVSGTFNTIPWSSSNKYLQVEIDPAGGTSYANAGTSQLLSVPFAIFANTANNANNAGNATTTTAVAGTTNYLPRFTSSTALGNSHVYDNGTTVSVDTSTPTSMAKFQVNGVGTYGALPYYQAGIVSDGSATSASATGVFGSCGWRGVYGYNPGSATGVEAIGVYGRCEGSSWTGSGYGTKGDAVGTGPTNYGAYGSASGASTHNYGVYGTASGTGAYAGYFSGNVQITGSIAKGSGTFKIDHPLDPENKYLYHSFVESPDMMNIYNGNAVTDANGRATVTLPGYFEALNTDFRYQLTTIGQPAQAYVLSEVSGNRFVIKTDKPNVKVSWQVTGVRQDKYANAHRVVPEVDKEPEYKGYYLHAAEWGMPANKSINYLTNPQPTETNIPQKKN